MGRINDILAEFNEKTDYWCNWFDKELKSVFNIDVYKHKFNTSKGFSIITENNIDILIIRLENMDDCFNVAAKDFLNTNKCIKLYRSNTAKDKRYYSSYKYVLENIKVPKELCNKIYSTKFARHFYTDDEIDQFINRWGLSQKSYLMK